METTQKKSDSSISTILRVENNTPTNGVKMAIIGTAMAASLFSGNTMASVNSLARSENIGKMQTVQTRMITGTTDSTVHEKGSTFSKSPKIQNGPITAHKIGVQKKEGFNVVKAISVGFTGIVVAVVVLSMAG